jgi:hypothetical protein
MRITVIISGGNVQAVYAPDGTEVEILDYDNPGRSNLESDGEICPQEIIDEIETKIREAGEQC